MNNIRILLYMLFAFMLVIVLGVYLLIFYNVDYYLTTTNLVTDQNNNMSEYNDQTFGKIADAFLTTADMLGYIVIFSMVLFMFVNAYYTRGKYPDLMLIIDILLLVFYYVVAVYLSNTYLTLISSTSELDIYSDYLPKSSYIISHLPAFVSIIGTIMLILSYSHLPKGEDEINIQNAY